MNEERHAQYMGVICLDRDGLNIDPNMHMRYRDGTNDSLTTLAAPLRPDDTQIELVDASGWNDSAGDAKKRGVIIFGYKDSYGRRYDHYSRLVEIGLFETSGVNKATHIITLNAPLPASLGNPDDGNGEWPIGTSLANCSNSARKYSFFRALVLPDVDRWYKVTNFIGGIDQSGTDEDRNFAPGTAAIQLYWLPNQINRSGGYGTAPDTGVAQRVWFAGLGVQNEPTVRVEISAVVGEEGRVVVRVLSEDETTGVLSMAEPVQITEALN